MVSWRRCAGSVVRPLPSLEVHVSVNPGGISLGKHWNPTLALLPLKVDAGRGHEHIVDNGEAALAAHPLAGLGADAGIVEDSGLVEQDAAAVDGAGKGHLLRVEVVEGGLPLDFVGLVAEYVEDRVRGKQDVGIGREVCGGIASVSRPPGELGLLDRTYCGWS